MTTEKSSPEKLLEIFPIKEENIKSDNSVSHSLEDSPVMVAKKVNLVPSSGGGGPCQHERCKFDPEELEVQLDEIHDQFNEYLGLEEADGFVEDIVMTRIK